MGYHLKIFHFYLLFLFFSSFSFSHFSGFDIDFFYPENDFRRKHNIMPFPNIAVENPYCKDLRTLGYMSIAYNPTPNVIPHNCPSSVINFLLEENIKNVQFFRAYWYHLYAFCFPYNYITQLWAMEKMPYTSTQTIVVDSGIFEPHNLEAVNDEIGINSVIQQEMSYRDNISLQGKAHFKKIEYKGTIPTFGWFVSVYDPRKNTGYDNFNTQQTKKAIVIFIKIIDPIHDPCLLGKHSDKIITYLKLKPQFWKL